MRLYEDDMPWRKNAACLNVDPALFFPGRGESCKEAKAVCAECRVRQECLDYALDDRELWGIWGGTSEKERRLLRRGRKSAA